MWWKLRAGIDVSIRNTYPMIIFLPWFLAQITLKDFDWLCNLDMQDTLKDPENESRWKLRASIDVSIPNTLLMVIFLPWFLAQITFKEDLSWLCNLDMQDTLKPPNKIPKMTHRPSVCI